MPSTRDNSGAFSLWDYSAPEAPAFEPLDGDVSTTVAIVGGGFTGNSTALHLAEQGIDCRVVEANDIGYGGSGRNVGLVNAGLWLPPQDVRSTLGSEYGRRLVDELGAAPEYVFSLIERFQIQCEATRNGTIHAAHSPAGFADLQRRTDEWHRLGAPVDLLNRDEAREKIGSSAFYGGLLDRRAGTINPMGYVRGLARAAHNAGARIHIGTRALKLTQQGDAWLLETDRGTISAKHVVLGTNAYTDDLWPGLKDTFTTIHYFQVATEPLGERASHILSERQGVWDTGKVMFSVRKDAEGRLLFGSMGKLVGGKEAALSKHWAKKTLKRLFPEVGPVDWEKAWFGRIAMTADHLPRIHRLAPNVYTPIGFNGRGITPGTIFGRALAELLGGASEDDLPLPVTDMKPDPSTAWKSVLLESAFKAYRVYKSI